MNYFEFYEIEESLQVDAKLAKKKFLELSRKYHPDLNPDNKEAEKKFKEINEANEVLSNPVNRKKYDDYGQDWKHGEAQNHARQQQQRSTNQQSNQAFGRRRSHNQ